MEFLELKNISERYMELVNPSSPEKVVKIGHVLGLNENSRVIEFGCGYGEILALWAEHFGVSGVGIDIRQHACDRARQKMFDRGFADRIEIVCANGAEYEFEEHAYDVAACIGATFIWDGFGPAIRAMGRAICHEGKLAVGEAYWLTAHIPHEYVQQEPHFHTEVELLHIARQEGFDFEYLVRARQLISMSHARLSTWRPCLMPAVTR